MTFWCIEHLHRLPQELHEVGAGALAHALSAYGRVSALLQEEAAVAARRPGGRDSHDG